MWDEFEYDVLNQTLSYDEVMKRIKELLQGPNLPQTTHGVCTSCLEDTEFIAGDGIPRTYRKETSIVPAEVEDIHVRALEQQYPSQRSTLFQQMEGKSKRKKNQLYNEIKALTKEREIPWTITILPPMSILPPIKILPSKKT